MNLSKIKIVRLVLVVTCFNFGGCSDNVTTSNVPFIFEQPNYNLISINVQKDTINFPLNENIYNNIKSFNVFYDNGEYMSLYDERSQSIGLYDLTTKALVKQVMLKKILGNVKLYKTSVYTKGFDSIYVTNNTFLYLADTLGRKKKTIKFLADPEFAFAFFKHNVPPVFKQEVVYAAVRPYAKETSLKALREWKLFYEFDIKGNSTSLRLNYPKYLQENYYGHRFMNFTYCINDSNELVMSFPADTNIYVGSASVYKRAYLGRSHLYNEVISPTNKSSLANDDGFKEYLLRNSYEGIFYDAYRKRYLRIAKGKISEESYSEKKYKKKQSVIILNSDYKIVGESVINDEVLLQDLFITKKGMVYARIFPNNENAIQFIRLAYSDAN